MRFGLFGKTAGRDASEKAALAQAADRIKAETRAVLGLGEDAAVAVPYL